MHYNNLNENWFIEYVWFAYLGGSQYTRFIMIKIVNFLGSSYSLKNTFSAFDIRIYNEK